MYRDVFEHRNEFFEIVLEFVMRSFQNIANPRSKCNVFPQYAMRLLNDGVGAAGQRGIETPL